MEPNAIENTIIGFENRAGKFVTVDKKPFITTPIQRYVNKENLKYVAPFILVPILLAGLKPAFILKDVGVITNNPLTKKQPEIHYPKFAIFSIIIALAIDFVIYKFTQNKID